MRLSSSKNNMSTNQPEKFHLIYDYYLAVFPILPYSCNYILPEINYSFFFNYSIIIVIENRNNRFILLLYSYKSVIRFISFNLF